MLQMICDILYYVFILIFGVYSAMRLSCGSFTRREWNTCGVLCPVLLLVQGILLEFLGMQWIWKLYPLIVHVPVVLVFILYLRVKWDVALLSVVISYSLCQLMRWIGLVVDVFFLQPLSALIIHLSLCMLLFFLLERYCLSSIHAMFCGSEKLFRVFGALPMLYYSYEYFMMYTQRRFAEVLVFQELLPTAMLLFFTLFIIIYQREEEKCSLAGQQSFMLEMELDHAKSEINALRIVKEQTAVYRHDMRHHLGMISSLIAANKPDQAMDYIRRTSGEIEAIVPRRYCENDTISLLLGAFQKKAEDMNASLSVRISLPVQPCLNDMELCVILSNGLENALHAVDGLPQDAADREISVFVGSSHNKLLIEIKNPYAGSIAFENGIPVAQDRELHYGCRSIVSVVQRRNGIYSFEAEEGRFLLQIAIPSA